MMKDTIIKDIVLVALGVMSVALCLGMCIRDDMLSTRHRSYTVVIDRKIVVEQHAGLVEDTGECEPALLGTDGKVYRPIDGKTFNAAREGQTVKVVTDITPTPYK